MRCRCSQPNSELPEYGGSGCGWLTPAQTTHAHIPHGRLVHFLDYRVHPGNKVTSTDERHQCRWEPTMVNLTQRRKVHTTTLNSL